jgi:hypothetical protein
MTQDPRRSRGTMRPATRTPTKCRCRAISIVLRGSDGCSGQTKKATTEAFVRSSRCARPRSLIRADQHESSRLPIIEASRVHVPFETLPQQSCDRERLGPIKPLRLRTDSDDCPRRWPKYRQVERRRHPAAFQPKRRSRANRLPGRDRAVRAATATAGAVPSSFAIFSVLYRYGTG